MTVWNWFDIQNVCAIDKHLPPLFSLLGVYFKIFWNLTNIISIIFHFFSWLSVGVHCSASLALCLFASLTLWLFYSLPLWLSDSLSLLSPPALRFLVCVIQDRSPQILQSCKNHIWKTQYLGNFGYKISFVAKLTFEANYWFQLIQHILTPRSKFVDPQAICFDQIPK